MTWPRPLPSSRAAAAAELEAIQIHEKPADVLANQIVGLELDYGEITLERAHQILTRAYPFRELTLDELKNRRLSKWRSID